MVSLLDWFKSSDEEEKDPMEARKRQQQLDEEEKKAEEEEKKKSLKDAVKGEPEEEEKKEEKKPGIKDAMAQEKEPAKPESQPEVQAVASAEPGQGLSAAQTEIPLSKQYEKELEPYTKQIAGLESQLADIRKQKQNARQEAKTLEFIQGLSNAITKYAAARYGLKHGVDMSGVKGMDLGIDKALKNDLASLEEEAAAITGQYGRAVGAMEKLKELQRARKEKEIDQATAAEQAKSEREFRSAEAEKQRKFTSEEAGKEREADALRASVKQDIDKAKEGKGLSTGEVSDLLKLDDALAMLAKIKSEKTGEGTGEGIDTGFFANLYNDAARAFGKGDPRMNTLKEDLADLLSQKIKTLSGAAASDKEREFLKNTLPHAGQDDEQFMASLKNATEKIQGIRDRYVKNLEKLGKSGISNYVVSDDDSFDWAVDKGKNDEFKTINGKRYRKVEDGWAPVR